MAAFAVLILAEPASAQLTLSGIVRDAKDQPVEGATVTLTNVARSMKYEAKTDANGEWTQVGLQVGAYQVFAIKDEIKSETLQITFRAGAAKVPPLILGGGAAGVAAELTRLFEEGVAASNAQQYDAAIGKFYEAIKINGNCSDCFNNIGFIHVQRKEYDLAEAAYKQSALVNPNNNSAAYNGLATVYNVQRKFDLAAEMSAKAGGGVAGAAGSDPAALYNTAVILWNGGKVAEAKAAFQATIAADPNHAEAHYQLGMVYVNEGDLANAATELDTYLKLAPTGQYAETAKALLSELKK
jgi:Flp pilus assembly protein TadD